MSDTPPLILDAVLCSKTRLFSGNLTNQTCISTLHHQSLARTTLSQTGLALLMACFFVILPQWVFGAEDDAYSKNDLLLFSQNPAGTSGSDKLVYFSLGSTLNIFRRAATPGEPTYGSTVRLGNIGAILTSTFGSDWTGLASSIYFGAAGQNGATNAILTAISNGDLARTVYVTKARSGVGSVGQANSASPLFDPAQTAVAGQISGSNTIAGMTQPGVTAVGDTLLDDYNAFSSGNPSTAYGAINGSIMQPVGSSLTFASIKGVVLLDLYRVTKTSGTNGASGTAWHNANSITATYSDNTYPGSNSARADYLGTLAVEADGSVYFVAAGSMPLGDRPQITSSLTANGTVGVRFTYQIQASNSPTSFGVSGLPSGLSANSSTGLIEGILEKTVIAAVTISATNQAGTGTKSLRITISPAAFTSTTQQPVAFSPAEPTSQQRKKKGQKVKSKKKSKKTKKSKKL
jgi:hypothetical protein